MSNLRISRKPITLHEIVEELERNDEMEVPDSITIMPPENCNAEITDEDSGDEDFVSIHNLPGSQLRAPAEILRDFSDNDDSEDDNLPLAQLTKRRRIDSVPKSLFRGSLPPPDPETTSTTPLAEEPIPSTSRSMPRLSTLKNETYTWCSRDIQPTHNLWQNVLGPANSMEPVDYFECMFDNSVIEVMVKYTNLYATQKNKEGNISTSEMKCFLGILLYSGYVVVPRRSMYWENTPDCGMPIIFNAMSRDRFSFIMSNIHCCDNTQLNMNDKFSKLEPLFRLLRENFLKFAPYQECHSIDEAMVPYYGGHPSKQFIRGKPIRWGYKFWVGATRLGYVIWFQPYQGQQGSFEIEYKSLGLGASVVLQYADVLQKMYPEAPFHLFFDNFFTSIPLIEELGNRGLKATGTIRENRLSKCPLPPNKDLQKSERGTYVYKSTRAENIVVCKWNDNSVVTAASNAVKVLPVNKVKRFSQQQKKYILVDQPAVIKAYNENMGGVDRSDQNIGLYRTGIRGKKWYFALISHCLDMATHNAWQIYKQNGGQLDHLKFRRNVAVNLLEKNKKTESNRGGRVSQSLSTPQRYSHNGHLVKYREDRLRCGVCHKSANFFCLKCNVTLHPKTCFESYHTLSK